MLDHSYQHTRLILGCLPKASHGLNQILCRHSNN